MLIVLDSSLDKPLYVQIRDQIRGRITAGDLKPGDRLEPSRELAKGLKVNRTTVGNAYADLEAEGLIQGTVGCGTFVLPPAAGLKAADLPRRRATSDMFWASAGPFRGHARFSKNRVGGRPITRNAVGHYDV